MIVDVRGRPYSQHRPAYMRAKQEFGQIFRQRPRADRNMSAKEQFWEELGDYINAKIVIEDWVDSLPRVTGLEFHSDEAFAWFLLRWS